MNMQPFSQEQSDTELLAAVERWERGEPAERILAGFSGDRAELEAIFGALSGIRAMKGEIAPGRALAERVLAAIRAQGVTPFMDTRFTDTKGRETTVRQIQEFMSSMTKSLVALGVGVVVVLAIVAYAPRGTERSSSPSAYNSAGTENAAPSGNVSDAVAAFEAGASAEASIADEESQDATLVRSDADAMNDFGQSYNENEIQ